jgi:hypothetical protein
MRRACLLSLGCVLAGCAVETDSGASSGTPDSGINMTDQGPGEEGGPGESEGDGDGDTNGDGDGDTNGDGDSDPTGDDDTGGIKFDLAPIGDNSTGGCAVPSHDECDEDSNDPWHALGINCPGELEFDTSYTGQQQQVYVHTGQLGTFNNPPTYPTLEGAKMVILSSGNAMEMTSVGDQFASTAINNAFQPTPLPAPINPTKVDPNLTCADNANLVGSGDCSNTLQQQWDQGDGAFDYAELRLTGKVPLGASGFEYHLAFFSTEYPNYYQSVFNDMYIAWLESELWTGNISFDEMGHPISLNAGFLDYKDAPNPYDCPGVCQAPQLQGTAMQTHAGTKWLTTTAGVMPGEDITLVWAIFDLSDEVLDSVVILDAFSWNCEGGPPTTIPG